MAGEPRHRHPLPRPISQHLVPEPQPAHTRRSDADTESDNEREATELRSVPSFQQSGRQNSRILSSPPAISTNSHWYNLNPARRFWRHCVRITVPHDDCRDHLGKASVLCCARGCRGQPSLWLSHTPQLSSFTTDTSCDHQQMREHF
jgi:hypothetical protein